MADYNPNQFDLSPAEKAYHAGRGLKTWNEHASDREAELLLEVAKLKQEIKTLKGIKTYEVLVTRTFAYSTDAENEDQARSWYLSTGQYLVPNVGQTREEIIVKEAK